MCLYTGAAFLGPADVVLDLAGRRLLFAPGLTGAERATLARRVLAAAGQEQPEDQSAGVTCICGFELDVTLADLAPAAFLNGIRQRGVVRLTLAGHAVAVDMEPAREWDGPAAWAAVKSLVTGDDGSAP